MKGQSFLFEPSAEAFHYAERSLDSWTRVAFDYGLHDVSFGKTEQPWVLDQIDWMFSERHAAPASGRARVAAQPALAAIVQRFMVAGAMMAHSLRTEVGRPAVAEWRIRP